MTAVDVKSPLVAPGIGSAKSAGVLSPSKRLFDVVVAVLALILLLPLLLLVAVAVRIESPGPALFRQARTGLNGRPFLIFKFRTMCDVPETGEIRQACLGDPRVTRLGRILRRTSLDELPQILNVIKGEMSLVGPRPHALYHDEIWAGLTPEYARRFSARPGLTGLAQVSGFRGEILCIENLERRVAADIRYIDDWSFWGDVAIILKTLAVVRIDPAAY